VLNQPHYLTIFYGFASSRSVETTIFSADVVFRECGRWVFLRKSGR